MMCKETMLAIPYEREICETALIFFDLESECNLITEVMANKLCLIVERHRNEIKITGIASKKNSSTVTTLGIGTMSGNIRNARAESIIGKKLEAIGNKELMIDNQGNEDLNAFQKPITRDKEGRCVVSWLWKRNDVVSAKGYGLALGRLKSTIRKCKKAPLRYLF
ncbi:Attacin-A [Dirofilaria immitis]